MISTKCVRDLRELGAKSQPLLLETYQPTLELLDPPRNRVKLDPEILETRRHTVHALDKLPGQRADAVDVLVLRLDRLRQPLEGTTVDLSLSIDPPQVNVHCLHIPDETVDPMVDCIAVL